MKGVDNATVARALRSVKELEVLDALRNRRKPGRDPGDAMGDFLDDE